MNSESPFNILFLCTGNSARSIIAEAILNELGAGRVKAFSAGSHPKDAPHPAALALLKDAGIATGDLRSKCWDTFSKSNAPKIDLVITVCDQAAVESCPVWPGHPLQIHWGMPDPAAVAGPSPEQTQAFRATAQILTARLKRLLGLLEETSGAPNIDDLRAIGQIDARDASPIR